jgi:hypothetical protein
MAEENNYNNDHLMSLYQTLKENDMFKRKGLSYDQFERDMQGRGYNTQIWKLLRDNGAEVSSHPWEFRKWAGVDDFDNTLWRKNAAKKAQRLVQSANALQQRNAGFGKYIDGQRGKAVFNINVNIGKKKKSNVVVDKATGKAYTQGGEEFNANDKSSMQDAEHLQELYDKQQHVYNEAVDNGMIADPMDVDAGLSDAEVKRRMMERRKAYATREMNKRGDEIDTRYAGMPQQFNSHTESTMQAQGYKSSDQEYQLWKTTKQKSEDTMQMLDQQIREERQKKEDGDSWLSQTGSAISNFGRGIWDAVTDYRSWEPGITEMQEANTMLDAKRHMEKGSIKEGSDEDIATQVMLTSLRDYDDQQRYQAANGSKAYSNGAMTGISLTLLPQFLITGGSATLTKGGAKLLTKMGIKEAEKGFQKYAVKAMGRVLSDAARATLLTGVLQGGKTYAAIMDDYLGVTNEKGATTYDENGKLKFNEGKSLSRSIYDAGTQQFVENFSELMGEWLPGGEQIAQGLRHIGLSKVADMFAHIGSNGVYQALSHADRYTGVSGIFGEIMEEEFGIALNSMLNNGGSQWSDFIDGDKQFDLVSGLFFSVGAMNAPRYIAGTYSGAQYMRYKHYTDNADKEAQNVLGGRWDSIRDVIDGTTNDDMTKVVRSYLSQKDKYTSAERNAISKYALNLSRMRGYNTALTANTAQEAEEAKNDPEKQEEMLRGQERNASYMAGANATADQRRGLQLGYEQARKKLSESIGIEEPELEQMSENDILDKLQDDDQLDMADDFLKKKAAHNGMQDAANQMVEDAKQQATAEVDKMTNQKKGIIQSATLKSIDEEEDKDVYVVGGNLVTFSDGTIDHENSDKMIVIYNPETKERETISPSRLLQVTEERTAQEVKDEAAETAVQKVQASNENDISGKVATGSVYSVIDETGATHTIEVGETNQDGTVNATYDGQPMVSTLEALQQERDMSDAALVQVQSSAEALSETKQKDDESGLQREEAVADEVKDFVDNIEFDRMIDEDGSIIPVDVEKPEQGHTYYKTGQTGQGNSARYNIAEFDANMNYVGTHRMTATDVVLNDPMSVDEKKEQLRSSAVSEYLQSINEHQQERQATENNDAEDINDNVEEPQQGQREGDEVATDNVAESKEDTSALSRIPVDEKTQEPLFEQVDSETALQGLNELTGNNTNSVAAIVNAQVQQANKALETLKGKKPKKATPKLQGSPMEMLKAQQQAEAKYESDMEKYNAQVDAAEQKVKTWNNIASAMLQEQESKRKEKEAETNEVENANASNEGATVKSSAKKRRALETAYVSQKEEHHPTVVSSADGAKVLKNIDNLVKNYENVSNQVKTFIGDVAKALGAERKGSKSEYATFETKNGKIVTIRLADHNAKVSNFDNRNELDGISIVISPKANEGIINNGDAHVTEFFYDARKLRKADGKPLVDILNSIKQTLYSGEFKDETGLAERQEVNGVDTNVLDNNTDSEVLDKVEEGHEGVTDWFMPKAMRKDIEKIAKKLGYNVQWLYTNDKSNGFFVGNTVYLSLDAERPYQFVFGHEMTHAIKSQHPQLYKRLMDAAKAMYADDEEFQKRVEDTTELYRSRMGGYFTTDAEGNKVEDMDAYTEEVVADTMGEAIFNAGLMRDIAFNLDHPTLAAIRDAITNLLQHLTGKNLKNAVDSLSAITDVYNQAYEEHKQGKSSEKTKESNKENGQDIDEYKNGYSAPSEETDNAQMLDVRTMSEADKQKRGNLQTGEGVKALSTAVTEGNSDIKDASGEVVAQTDADHKAKLSLRTYTPWVDNFGRQHEGTRAQVLEYMKKNGFADDQIKNMLDTMDYWYKYFNKLAEFTNPDGTYRFDELHRWNERQPQYKAIGKNIENVVSTAIKNGEYAVNQELSTDCIKREAFTKLVNHLIARGADLSAMGPAQINTIKDMMRKYGIQVACDLCFVEGKRLGIVNWAQTFVDDWNKALEAAGFNPDELEDFNFGHYAYDENGNVIGDAAFVPTEEYKNSTQVRAINEAYALLTQRGKDYYNAMKKRNVANWKQWLKDNQVVKEWKAKHKGEKWSESYLTNDQKEIKRSFLTFGVDDPKKIYRNSMEYAKRYAEMEKKYQEKHPGKAFTPTKTQLEDLGKIRNREIKDIFKKMQRLIIEFPEMRKKMQLSDLLGSKGLMQIRQENGEGYAQLWSLILGRFGSGTPKPIQDAVPYSGEIFDITDGLISKAYEEGGARMFSFSDFDITKVFDIMQIYWDMAAREMKLQSYSKEAAYIIMFGKTGAKINMSTLPKAVVSEDLQRRYNEAKKDEERNAAQKEGAEYAGLITDENGRIVDLSWSEEHSLKPDFCQSIFRDPERNGNCGAVTVGASVNHSIFAAAQPWIRMVIPFHLSGMPIEARKRTDVNWYFDNTPHQNTRVKIGGSWVSIHSEKAEKAKLQDFNFYENEDSADWDMRQRCRDYLKWCDEKGYTPRFEWGIDSDHYKEWCAGKGYTPNQQIVDIMDNDMTDGVWNGYYKFITDFNAYKPVLDKMGNPVFDENGHLVETVAKHMPVTTNIKLSDAERRAVFGDITGDATEFADMSVLQNRENSINYADANMQKMAAEVQQYLDMTRKHQEGEVTDADIEQAEADMKGEGGTFFNSANDAEILMEAEKENIPQTFDDFLASDGMKYSIRNEQERQAAENAYDFAKENRPDSYHQYAVLDMSKPGLLPQYYMKQQLADKWRRYANKLQWGNYKMFDLDKPFEENVPKLKGAFPEQYANTIAENLPESPKYSLRETKFKHELAEWKKQNGLPKTAKEPQVPIRDINETDAEWKQRLAEYRKEAALWKTAPTYEADLVVGDDAEAIYNRALQRKSIQARIVIQDGMLAIREAQNAISREVGSKIGTQEDAYNAENRSHGKAKNEMEEYNHFYLEPLRKAYNALKNQMGGYGYVKNYLMAKHGLERNAYMAFMAAAEEQVKTEIDDIKKQHAKIDAKIAADKTLSAADKQQQRADNKQQEKDEIDKVQSARERLTDYQNDISRIMNDADYRAGKIDFETYRQRDNSIRIQYAPMYLNHRYDKMGIPRDFSGLSALFGNETKRDFELEAGDYVTETENKHGGYTDDLWDAIHAATNKTLFDSYRAGMMTKKQYQSVHEMFQDYIPLRGWNETTADEVWDYVQGSNGGMSSILQAMHGRESIADDPIAYIEQMAQSAIIINNKNDVKQRLLLLARNHPTSLLTLSKAWYIKTTDAQGNEKWIPASPNIPSDVKTSKEVQQYIDQFEQNMKQLEKTGDATQKKDGLHIEYPQTTGQEREHEIRVMDRGQEYVIYVNGDPALAQAINGTKSEKVREDSGLIDKATAKVGRFLSQVYTSFSPMFVPSNYFRDLTMVSASTAVREDGHYNALLYKNFLQNWGIHKLVAAYSNGSLKQKIDNGTATKNEEDFYNYMMNGGETGYVTSVTVDEFKSKIMSELGKMDEHKLNPKKLWRAYGETVEFLNRGVEASNRYLVYKTSIEYGRSVEEAINDAKNVTLNFNRKGTGEHGVQVIRNLYLFINPAIQSLQTLGALAKDHPGKLSTVAMAWIASGALVPAFNQAMLSAFGDDDDKDKYWRMAKWDRRNNAILYIPFSKEIFGETNFVKIPLAQEFRAFYGLGDMLASIDSELAKQTGKEYASDIMGQILDLLPLDPTGYGGQPLLALMPDALRWPFALAMNTDFTGKPISKESEYNKYMPTYTKAYKGTPDWLVQTSRTINAIGNDFPDEHQNGIDRTGLINPAKTDYVLKTLLGGSYTFLSKGAGVATKMLREGPGAISTADVPLWSSFVINPNNRPQSQKQGDGFWDMADQCARVESEIGTIRKEAEATNDFDKLKRYVHSADYREYLDNKDKVDAYQEQKKIEKLVAKGQGDTYKPHKTNADDIYNKHRTIDDIYEDTKLDILWKKLNAYDTKFNALGGWSKDAGRIFHRDHPEEFTALRMAKIHMELLSTMKKLMYINGKDKSTEPKMKRVRKQRQILLQELEAATKNIKAPE